MYIGNLFEKPFHAPWRTSLCVKTNPKRRQDEFISPSRRIGPFVKASWKALFSFQVNHVVKKVLYRFST